MKLIRVIPVLILAFTCKTLIMLENSRLDFKSFNFGERAKAILATELWNRADSLMHKGSIDIKSQKFRAGSYIGNTDIIPLLKSVIFLKPNELIPYKMLSQNYIYSENNLNKALQTLTDGIITNPKHKELYELYIEIAKLKIFYSDKKTEMTKLSALKYLEKALQIYPDNIGYTPSDIALTKENINLLMARIYIELDKPQNALEQLLNANIPLDSSDDIIFNCLKQYKESGIIDKSLFKSINHEVNADDKDKLNHHEHNHLINNGNNTKNNLLSKSNYLILKAGLLLLLCILGCCYL